MERAELKKREQEFLTTEKEKYPELFERLETVDNQEFLRDYGIYIPGKDHFPKGRVKVLPSDFIVEETTSSGNLCTIDFSDDKEKGKENNTDGQNQTNGLNSPTYATLVKCGISTIDAIDDMTKQLGFDPRRHDEIGYAGIKDKEAITAQEISFRNVPADILTKIYSDEYFLKDVRPGKGMLAKGDLQKNRFTILVRTDDLDTEETAATVTNQIRQIKDHGFYNYYYLQRFGNPRLINFVWGVHIIKGEYRQAVEHYLSYAAPRELEYFRGIRRKIGSLMSTGKWDEIAKILEPFPLIFLNESRMVNHLRAHPADYLGALLVVPDQVLLWVYAVPSLLFNEKIAALLERGETVPPSLPLVLSENPADTELYREQLQALGLYPLRFNYLRPFRNIYIRRRTVPTLEPVEFHAADIVPEGMLISFSLGKGEYATTFLSHIFNLTAGNQENKNKDPKNENSHVNIIDCKNILEGKNMQKTLDFFAKQINKNQEKE
jgi:TruD family tRNA pseudouridine synthase